MKCPGIMHVVAFDMVYSLAQKVHWWFMKWIYWDFLYLFVFFHALFCYLPLFLDIRPWYASIFSSLLERDPRKSGVVVMAAKLTSSASPYPFSFIIHPFIQYAYVPIVHLSTSLSRSSYPFPPSCLRESSISYHTHLPLIHSPSHSLAYMESLGCMPSFTPSHTH